MVSSSMLSSLIYEGVRCGKIINEEVVANSDDVNVREKFVSDPDSLFTDVPEEPSNQVERGNSLNSDNTSVSTSSQGTGSGSSDSGGTSSSNKNGELYGVIEDKGNGISYHLNKKNLHGQIMKTAGVIAVGYVIDKILGLLKSDPKNYKLVEPEKTADAGKCNPVVDEIEQSKEDNNNSTDNLGFAWFFKIGKWVCQCVAAFAVYCGVVRALEKMGDIPYLGRACVWLGFCLGGDRLLCEDENGKLIPDEPAPEDDRVWMDYTCDLCPYPDDTSQMGCVLRYDKTYNYWYPMYRYNYDKGDFYSQLEIAIATNYEIKLIDSPREIEAIKDKYDMLTLAKLNKRSKIVLNNVVSKNNYAVYATWSQYVKVKDSTIKPDYDSVPKVNGVQMMIMGGYFRDDSVTVFNFAKILDDGSKNWLHRIISYDGNFPLVNLEQVDVSARIPCA